MTWIDTALGVASWLFRSRDVESLTYAIWALVLAVVFLALTIYKKSS
jgi:hypothetical protein